MHKHVKYLRPLKRLPPSGRVGIHLHWFFLLSSLQRPVSNYLQHSGSLICVTSFFREKCFERKKFYFGKKNCFSAEDISQRGFAMPENQFSRVIICVLLSNGRCPSEMENNFKAKTFLMFVPELLCQVAWLCERRLRLC